MVSAKLLSRLFVLAGLASFSQRAHADLLTLHDAVATAQSMSPEIHSLQNQVLSAEAKSRWALAPYEPNLTLTFADLPQDTSLGSPADIGFQVQEQIGFPGRAFTNRSQLDHQAKSLEAQLHATELQISSNTKTAYFQLVLAQQNLQLNMDQRESYLRIEQIAKRRYAAGAISQVDLLNAQVTLYSNASDLSDLQSAERTARAQLNVILGWPTDKMFEVEPFKTTFFPLPTKADAENKMLVSRHEIHAAQETAHASEEALTLAKLSLLPDFFVTVGATDYKYGPASPWAGMNSGYPTYTYMASLQVMIPIFGLFNEREVIRGAGRDRAAAQANLQITLNQSRIALTTALETLTALQARLKNNDDHLLPLSDQAFSLALINYSAGKIDFQTLSDTATSRRNIRQAHLQAIMNFLTNYAALGQLLGEDL